MEKKKEFLLDHVKGKKEVNSIIKTIPNIKQYTKPMICNVCRLFHFWQNLSNFMVKEC
jgi:hypothetical protein